MLNRLVEHLEAKYGGWIDKFGSALEHAIKESRVNWHEIHDVDQRFLAALLLTFPTRNEIVATIEKYRETTDPVAWLVERLQGMIEAKGLAVVINDFQFSVLRDLILGRSEAEVVAAVWLRAGTGRPLPTCKACAPPSGRSTSSSRCSRPEGTAAGFNRSRT